MIKKQMLKELIIKNFEAHDKLRIKFDSHINSIVGATDKGKSSTIRAIQWVVLNRPLGDSFIRDASKPAFVGIRTEKGTVSRKKGKGINQYKINGMTLEAFGTHVPNEVEEFLNMQELNFQFQFDAPYWFQISPGEVSKQLNQIVDLNIIDSTLSSLIGLVKRGKIETNMSQERMDGVKIELGHLSFVKPMYKQYKRLEGVETQVADGIEYVTSLSTEIDDVKRYIDKAKALSGAHTDGERVVEIGSEYQNLHGEVNRLVGAINEIEKVIAITDAEMPNLKPLEEIAGKWNELHNECKELSPIIKQLETEKEMKCPRTEDIQELKRELKRMMGKTCPLCEQPIK